MTQYLVFAVDQPALEPYEISQMLRGQLHYFTEGVNSRRWNDSENPDKFFFPLERTSELLEEGVFYVTSPLDDQHQAEIEITEEQENILEWIVSHKIENVRVSET